MAEWLADLQRAVEPDGVRILTHQFAKPGVSQFLVSTRPETAPERLVWSVKGRLQHLVRREYPKAFQRNYGLRSVGSATREAVEGYVRSQVGHHPMADPRVQETLQAVQIDNGGVDLSEPRQNAHARYWYNLHVCFVNEGRCMEIQSRPLRRMHDMILRAAARKGTFLSRAGIVPDHVHLTLGCNVSESPAEVALFVHEQPGIRMRPETGVCLWVLRRDLRAPHGLRVALGGCPPGLPQIRTCASIKAYGSSGHGFAT